MNRLFFRLEDAAKVNTFAELYILAYVSTVTVNDAQRYCVLTNQMLASAGISGRTATRAVQSLAEKGLITYEVKLNRKLHVLERRLYRACQSDILSTSENANLTHSESAKMADSENASLSVPKRQSGATESANVAHSSFTKEVDLKKVENRSRQLSSADTFFADDPNDEPQHFPAVSRTVQNTPTTFPAPPRYVRPKTEEEAYAQFQRYYADHLLEQPELSIIGNDLHIISERYWDYWTEKHWVRNGNDPVTNFRRAISNWLEKAVRDKRAEESRQPRKSFQQQERDHQEEMYQEMERIQARLVAEEEAKKLAPTFELLENAK